MNYCTPIQKLNYTEEGINLYVKRDDLLPLSFGGNKARIAAEYFADMKKNGFNCIIGYGNSRSNLNRVISNLASVNKIECHIVSPSDDDGKRITTNNSRLVEACGAVIHKCLKTQVAETIESVMAECKSKGLKPYYINGDAYGKGNEHTPVQAYVKAYEEIFRQAREMEISFEYIFLATGTGMTQSGLIAGKTLLGGNEKIIGISVAREAKTEAAVIKRYLSSYFDKFQKNISENLTVEVKDEYLKGGYGHYDEEIKALILKSYKEFGIPLDPTYTGKAFNGMLQYLKTNNIRNKNVLFIHTGGSPLFFDHLAAKEIPEIRLCSDQECLLDFLNSIDTQLPVPLSKRVNLHDYTEKILTHGKVLCIEKDEKIVAASLFYCNDTDSKQAYLTLLGTLPEYTGRGYAKALLSQSEEIAKNEGMKTFHLDTDINNYNAISLYSKCNYLIERVEHKVHMFKELNK